MVLHPSSAAGSRIQTAATNLPHVHVHAGLASVYPGANLRLAIWRAQHAATGIPNQTLSMEDATTITKYPMTMQMQNYPQ